MMEEEDIQIQTKEREIAQKLLTRYIGDVAENLNAFCINHLGDLKKTLITKSNKKKLPHGVFIKPTAHEIKNQTIKDLIFVMSEIANYLPSGQSLNQSKSLILIENIYIDFLETIV
jgi:hypothetical protein